MRKFKKFAAMVSAVALAACAVAPLASFAEGTNTGTSLTLTKPSNVPTDSTIANVKAYKIFNVEITDTGAVNIKGWAIPSTATGSKVQSELDKFIDAITDSSANLGLSKTTDSAGTKTQGVDEEEAGATFLAEQLTKWGNSTEAADKAKIEKFAKIAAETLTTSTAADKWESNKATFNNALTDGYYLFTGEIRLTQDSDTQVSKSLGMLTVVDGKKSDGSIGTGEAKVGLPTVQKKVKEDTKGAEDKAAYEGSDTQNNNSSGSPNEYAWNDVADYDIGDKVPFKLYGTMPDNLEKYDKYYYKFTDTLDSQFAMPETLTITIDPDGVNNTTATAMTYTASKPTSGDKWSVTSSSSSSTNGITVAYTKDATDTNKITGFTVEFNDIKGNQTVTDKNALVTIQYEAVLQKTAQVGRPGQENKVKLTYSNNPNNSGEGNTDRDDTPDDKVKVFTYGFEIEKKFFAYGSDSELAFGEIFDFNDDVKFKIKDKNNNYLKFSEHTNGTGEHFDYVLDANGQEELGLTVIDEANAEYTVSKAGDTTTLKIGSDTKYTISKDGDTFKVYDADGNEASGKTFHMVLRVKGLDDGDYTLEETAAPAGYNKVTAPFEIQAKTDNTQTWNGTTEALKAFDEDLKDGAADNEYNDGIAAEFINNNQGSELPGTGGIGTTIFYIGGGAMVAVAGVFLITKKRMSKKEN